MRIVQDKIPTYRMVQTLNTYQKRLVAWCDAIMAVMGWDLEKETADWESKGSRRITADENLRKAVYKAKAEVHTAYGLGITTLYDRIPQPDRYGAGWVNMFHYSRPEDFTIEAIEEQRSLALLILDLVNLYNDWVKGEFQLAVSGMASNGFFTNKDFTMHPSVLEAVNKLVLGGAFTSYLYRNTGEVINSTDKYYISSQIGFSTDLNLWLGHLQGQKEFLDRQSKDEVFVTMFGKMDEVHPIYSNWLLTLHKGGTIWIITDQVNFDNPRQKHVRLGRRSVWRDRDEHYDACDLPYELFHDMEALKASNNGLAKSNAYHRYKANFNTELGKLWRTEDDPRGKCEELFKKLLDKQGVEYDVIYAPLTGSSSFPKLEEAFARKQGKLVAYWSKEADEVIHYHRPEFFFKNFAELADGYKAFTVLLVQELIGYLSAENVKPAQIALATEFMEMKMLEGATIEPASPKHMKYWTDKHKQIFTELLETLEEGEEKSTALAVHTYDVVVKSEHYDASWLATPEQLASLAEWSVLDKEASALWGKRAALDATREEAYKQLLVMLNADYDAIAGRMLMAKDINFVTSTYNTFSTEGKMGTAGGVHEVKDVKSVYRYRGRGIGKNNDWGTEEFCKVCENSNIKPNFGKTIKTIRIRHYRELMWLLGITDRNKLPKYYRNYRAHNMIPYKGNSILQQTHPYLSVTDPCSRREPNGIEIGLYMCGRCYNKLKSPKDLEEILY